MTAASQKYLIFSVIGIVVLVIVGVGIAAGLYLSNKSQDTRQQASSGTGTATVAISPATKQLNGGEAGTFVVTFNTQGTPISGISVRLQYPYSGTQPLLTAGQPSAVIVQSDSNWNCPVGTTTTNGGVVTIDMGCLYLATAGFTSNADTQLFTFVATAGSIATSNPITISFNPTDTMITRKSDGEDVAATPTSNSSVTIVVSTPPTATPSPTPTNAPSPAPSPTLQPGATATPAPTASPTPVATTGSCNANCLANRECTTGLLCITGKCRNSRCSSDTTCGCADLNVASQSGTSELPDSGSVSTTLFSFFLGSLLLISGSTLLAARIKRET